MRKNHTQKSNIKSKTVETADIVDEKKVVSIPQVITVKELSDITGIPVVSLISELMKSGILAAINESIDFETAAIVCDDLGVKCELAVEMDRGSELVKEQEEENKTLKHRPPVVTIMGHVDHGKTSLLDKIRTANVASTESGGITQHISAYQASLKDASNKNLKNKTVTFIDTPGHAAFSALRGHGAAITDIVILIVAADDGVMPQTIEVIEQAKKYNVPVIVAINKIDLPDADIMKVKQQLSEHGLLTEEWGGKTVMVEVSAKTGKGIDDLLEVILLQAEIMDLKADYDAKAFGVVIESHMHKGAGPLALVLIENGTLHRGDIVQIGDTWGKVRILEDFRSQPIAEAGPSMPVRIAGLKGLPGFGEHLLVLGSEKEAKDASFKSARREKVKIATAKKLSESESSLADADLEFRIIIKADVKGSLEAIKKLLSEINTEELEIKIIGEGIGSVSESDVTLAKAARASVYSFRVPILVSAKKISEKDKVEIRSYDVIYELVDDVKRILTDKLPPIYNQEVLGKGEILAIFRDDKKAFVAGAKLSEGKITKADLIRFYEESEIIEESKINSLRREKTEVEEVQAGVEFGMSLDPGIKVAAGQKFEAYKVVEVKRSIK